jgi:hypothetical protein
MVALGAALGSRELRPVKAEVLTGPPDDARIKGFTRTSKRNFCLSVVSMNRHRDMPLMPLLMLMPIEPTSLFG